LRDQIRKGGSHAGLGLVLRVGGNRIVWLGAGTRGSLSWGVRKRQKGVTLGCGYLSTKKEARKEDRTTMLENRKIVAGEDTKRFATRGDGETKNGWLAKHRKQRTKPMCGRVRARSDLLGAVKRFLS